MAANIYQKLAAVQSELNVPKAQYNKFGDFNYRSCEDILEAAKPICQKNGAVVLLTDEVVLVGERRYVKATARFVSTDSQEEVTNTAYACEADTKKGMDSMQVSGATSSYSRKYALNGLFAIDDTKDSDTPEAKKQASGRGPRPGAGEGEPMKGVPCHVCGALVSAEFAEKSTAKYGKVYCTGECKDKDMGESA